MGVPRMGMRSGASARVSGIPAGVVPGWCRGAKERVHLSDGFSEMWITWAVKSQPVWPVMWVVHRPLGARVSIAPEIATMCGMTQTQQYTPGKILANIPGALGFYPEESVLFVGLTARSHAHLIGPIVRVDIDDFFVYFSEARAAAGAGCDAIFAFIVSQRDPREIRGVVEAMQDYEQESEMIVACWHTRGIFHGSSYRLCFGPQDAGLVDTPGRGEGLHERLADGWFRGRIPAIVTTASMEPWTQRGLLPEPSRADAFAHFARYPEPATGPAVKDVAESLRECAYLLRCGHGIGRQARLLPRDIVVDATRLLADLCPDDIAGRSWEYHLEDSEQVLLTVALWMCDIALRDLVIRNCLERPVAAAAVLLEVARHFDGEIRANALAIYSATLIRQGMSMIAGQPLQVIAGEFPEHSLGALLNTAYRSGLYDIITDNLERGSSVARRRWSARFKRNATAA